MKSKRISQAYSEHCQISKTRSFAKIVSSILDAWQRSEYTSEFCVSISEISSTAIAANNLEESHSPDVNHVILVRATGSYVGWVPKPDMPISGIRTGNLQYLSKARFPIVPSSPSCEYGSFNKSLPVLSVLHL